MKQLSEVEFIGHLPDVILVFEVDGEEIVVPSPKLGKYVLAKIGEQFVTIGRGLAEKERVE